ncbi:integumentary mucin A.1-like isoform X2 [Littorina saxatilis]|uniref:integumentary mucin A.1-like isoform X2 n=1 Tax=Littorina saxatilis TaxID=31220 RepID=UPI0038B5CD42
MAASIMFTICFVALAMGLSSASTLPPTPQLVQQQQQPEAIGGFGVVGVPAGVTDDDVATTEAVDVVTASDAPATAPATSSTGETTSESATTSTTATATSSTGETTPESATASTTAALPQPPFNCYDCNSGSPLPGYWINQNCDVTGYVAQWYVPSTCDSFCFSSVGLYPAGSVYRGCASSLWLGGRTLEEGCFEDLPNNRTVCLCAGDHCNTLDLSGLSQYYAGQYLTLQQANHV